MLSCGEASGDLYAGALVAALRRREPDVDVFGLGGERFAAAGGRLVADFHGLSVTGLTEVISVLPRTLATMKRLVNAAKTEKPQALVLIDYPDFNFRLMTRIRRLGIPVIYYVSPQLWAWRAGRIKQMKRRVDRVLPIFPFEEAIYRKEGIDVRFVGHPLIDLATPHCSREAFLQKLNLDPAKPVLALLPGSRTNEVARLAPLMAEAVPKIAARVPGVQFVVARAPELDDGLFDVFGLSGVTLRIADAQTDDVLNASDAVVTASGTATVQTALHGKPMAVVYQLSPTTYWLGKRLAQRRYLRDGQSHRRPARGPRVDPGRVHAGGDRRGSRAAAHRTGLSRTHDRITGRGATAARRTGGQRSCGGGDTGSDARGLRFQGFGDKIIRCASALLPSRSVSAW